MARGKNTARKRKTFQSSSKERLGYTFTDNGTREGRRIKFEKLHNKVHRMYQDEVAANQGLSSEYCEECNERILNSFLGKNLRCSGLVFGSNQSIH